MDEVKIWRFNMQVNIEHMQIPKTIDINKIHQILKDIVLYLAVLISYFQQIYLLNLQIVV